MEENQRSCAIWSPEHSRVESKSIHDALLLLEENQNFVPICFLVLPHIESNFSHDSKTLQNGLFFWNNSPAIKEILTSEYFSLYTLKYGYNVYSSVGLWPNSPPKRQNLKPPLSFSRALTRADYYFARYNCFFPPIFNRVNIDLLHSTDE